MSEWMSSPYSDRESSVSCEDAIRTKHHGEKNVTYVEVVVGETVRG